MEEGSRMQTMVDYVTGKVLGYSASITTLVLGTLHDERYSGGGTLLLPYPATEDEAQHELQRVKDEVRAALAERN